MQAKTERYYGNTLQNKMDILAELIDKLEIDGTVKVIVEESPKTQAELLEVNKKQTLLDYCRYAGLHVSTNWKKSQLAQAYSEFFQNNLWLLLLILPQESVQLCLRLNRCKKGEILAITESEDYTCLSILLFNGVLQPYFEAGTTGNDRIGLELAGGIAEEIQNYYKDKTHFEKKMPAAVYLPPELRAGNWKNICKGYERLDERVGKILRYYGLLNTEKLYLSLVECYQYTFSYVEFMRFLMMRMRLLEMVQTAYNVKTKERCAALGSFPIEPACEEKGRTSIVYRSVSSSQLEERDRFIISLLKPVGAILLEYVEYEEEYASAFMDYLISAAQLKAPWEFFLLFLDKILTTDDKLGVIALWYQISSLYLKLPVFTLGGFSRMEYASLHDIENPYEIHNDTMLGEASHKKEVIFRFPYRLQWEIYSALDKAINEPENRLFEKQLEKCAGRYLEQDDAELVVLYFYMAAASEKLYDYLIKLIERGNPAAIDLLQALSNMGPVD